MLLALRESFPRPHLRSTPSDVTLQAFDKVPAVPNEIQKEETLVILSNRNRQKARRIPRFFNRHQTAGSSNSTPVPRLSSINAISTRTETFSTDDQRVTACSLCISPVSDGSDIAVVQSVPAEAHHVDPQPIEPTLGVRSDQTLDSNAEIDLPPKHATGEFNPSKNQEIAAPVPALDIVSPSRSEQIHIPPLPNLQVSFTETNIQDPGANQFRPLKFIGPNCFRAIDAPIPKELELEFNPKLHQGLRSFLKSLELKNPEVMLDCVLASTKPDRKELKPTILFVCLNSEQHKTISTALKRREGKDPEVVPSLKYRYSVLIQETRLCSSCTSMPSNLGQLSGQIVEAILRNGPSLCGVLCKISDSVIGAQCTLGGLIEIEGSTYALTTSHAFLGKGNVCQVAEGPGEFQPVGNLQWYKYTETSPSSSSCFDGNEPLEPYDQDWALVRIQPSLHGMNLIQLPGSSDPAIIQGFLTKEELGHGIVHVLSAVSGTCEGYLSPGSAYWMLGNSCFEVKTIFLDAGLSDGDSGSWVIREGLLCGYILSRAVGKPWGYMLCIEPVLRDIRSAISRDDGVQLQLGMPSLARQDQAQHTRLLSNDDDLTERPLTERSEFSDSTATLADCVEVVHEESEGTPNPEQAINASALPQNHDSREKEMEKEKEKTSSVSERTRPDGNDGEISYPHGLKLHILTLAWCVSTFLAALDNYTVSTAIPIITTHFKSLDDVGWYASAYFLGTSAFQVVPRKLYSVSSTKLVYISSLGVYIAGSAICGSSSSSTALIIGRAVSGAASTGIYPGTLEMAASSMPLKERPRYNGLFGLMYAIASIVGPILGGSLTDKASWRWIFYIKIPGAFIVLTVIAFLFNTPEGARDSTTNVGWTSQITDLDIEGNVAMTASLTCLLLALNLGGTTMAWSDPRIISLICIFGILFVSFVAIQMWKQEKATILPRLIGRRSILGALWFSFTLGSSFQIVNYYLPFWFQTVKGASALKSGVMYFPMVISIVASSILSRAIVSKIGYYTPFMIGSSILTAIGFGMLSTLSPQSNHVAWISYQVLSGMGLGLGFQQPFTVAQNVLNLRDIPTGISIMILGQNLGAAIFASVSQNIFKGKLVSGLEHFAPFLDSATVLNDGAANLQNSIEPQYLGGVRLAYNGALSKSYTAAAVVAATTIVGSLAIEWKSVRGRRIETSAESRQESTAK